MNNYGLDIWADDNFAIIDGKLTIKGLDNIPIIDIVQELRQQKNKGPLLLRFPHLIYKQIDKLFQAFANSKNEYNYGASFRAVFPLKVNQLPNFVLPLVSYGKRYNYGLEAGSKAELILALLQNNIKAPITVNGFKDKQMITIGFIGAEMGYDITLIIEGLNELDSIIEVSKEYDLPIPNIGIRVKLHNSGSGVWAKSSGIDSKFGLSSTEILEAYDKLKQYNMIDKFNMIHFHIGSAINSISPLKKALKEAGNIYAELINLGAFGLRNINIGGGLNVENSTHNKSIEYSLKEFANDVIFTLKTISDSKNVPEPNIYTESGRFIASSSSILVTPVLELYSNEMNESSIRLKSSNPPLIDELYALFQEINVSNAIEYMHDSLEHLGSILTLFDLGYVDLQDRSNAEVLSHLIIKKAINLLSVDKYEELKKIQSKIQEKYLLNFSIFQSLPDLWGISQEFPMMPITHLDKKATRSATLWDITCDSDGEIPFDESKPLYLHDVDLKKDNYFVAFFNVGAYQDILGMRHNLFSHPTEVTITKSKDGIRYDNLIKSQKIIDIFEDLEYDIQTIKSKLSKKIQNPHIKELLLRYLEDNSYLSSGW